MAELELQHVDSSRQAVAICIKKNLDADAEIYKLQMRLLLSLVPQ